MGYTKLLHKISDSNLTLRQIKNGSTLFDKDFMKIKYTNPYLQNDKLMNQLGEYF